MKRIGLIGGVSPESTAVYYRLINGHARAALGGDHSAEMVVFSLDFGVMKERYAREDWDAFKRRVVAAATALDGAGCEVLAICSNTTQIAADAVAESTGKPLVRMIDVLASALEAGGARRPLLLGTPFVMEGEFYRASLEALFPGTCLVPGAEDRAEIDRVIFEELVSGEVREASKRAYLDIIETGRRAGADSVILGCTEIMLLIGQDDTDLPVFDSTSIHAAAIAEAAGYRG